MITLDVPPKLILPDHYQAHRPAIIRPGVDLANFFPVEIDRKTRRAIVKKLEQLGLIDDRAEAVKMVDAAIPFGMFAHSLSLEFLTSNTGDSATAVIPSSSVVGDLVVLVYVAVDSAATAPAYVDLEAVGYTIVFSGGGSSSRSRIGAFAKLVVSGEPGSNVVGPSGTNYSRYVAAVFRPTRRITSFTVNDREQFNAATPPAAYTKNVSSVPLGDVALVFAQWVGQAAFTPGGSPTMTDITTSNSLHKVRYTIYNPGTTKVNHTTSMPDTGTTNAHGSSYLTFTF